MERTASSMVQPPQQRQRDDLCQRCVRFGDGLREHGLHHCGKCSPYFDSGRGCPARDTPFPIAEPFNKIYLLAGSLPSFSRSPKVLSLIALFSFSVFSSASLILASSFSILVMFLARASP